MEYKIKLLVSKVINGGVRSIGDIVLVDKRTAYKLINAQEAESVAEQSEPRRAKRSQPEGTSEE